MLVRFKFINKCKYVLGLHASQFSKQVHSFFIPSSQITRQGINFQIKNIGFILKNSDDASYCPKFFCRKNVTGIRFHWNVILEF